MKTNTMNVETIYKQKVQTLLLEFLCRQFLVEEQDIELNESLVDTGIIDSMGLIEIASYIETNYSFTVTEEMMNRANFGSVIKIVDFINKHHGSNGSASKK